MKRIPVSTSYASEGPTPRAPFTGRGWSMEVLPQIEHGPLFERFEPTRTLTYNTSTDSINGTNIRPLLATPMPIFRCPSDSSPATITTQNQLSGITVTVTNYKGVIGDHTLGGVGSGAPDCHNTVGCNGLFFRNSYQTPITFSMIKDGLSNTFMLGEDVPTQNQHTAVFFANGDYAGCHWPLNTFREPADPSNWPQVMSFRSEHHGGANFAMADGSVKFVSETIDYANYRRHCTRNGREVVQVP